MKLRPRNKKKEIKKSEIETESETESEESFSDENFSEESENFSEEESENDSEEESENDSEEESENDSEEESENEVVNVDNIDKIDNINNEKINKYKRIREDSDSDSELDIPLNGKRKFQEYIDNLQVDEDYEIDHKIDHGHENMKKQKLSVEYCPDNLSIHLNIPSELLLSFIDYGFSGFDGEFGGEFGDRKMGGDDDSDVSSIIDLNGMKKKVKKSSNVDNSKRGAKNFVFNEKELEEIKDIKELESLKKLISILNNENATEDQKKLIEALKELDGLVGMNELKLQIIDQIMFYIQDFSSKDTFLHTVISGPPGVGKTVVAKIMAKIFVSLGFLTSDKVVMANRSKLIDGYLGGTAIKTQKLIKEAKGGVLFIDEAYSLGSVQGEDSFAKECIDTLNEYLSKYNNDLICIIAGYKEALDKFFFKQNEGLESRFPWRFTINAYSSEELYEIFIRQSVINGWKINVDKNIIINDFKKSMKAFSGNGRDTVNLFKSCQLCHSKRLFLEFYKKNQINPSKEINLIDFQNGFKTFMKNKKIVEPKEHLFMYS